MPLPRSAQYRELKLFLEASVEVPLIGRATMDTKSFLIGALIIALLAGGYFYYNATRNQVKIDGSGVQVHVN